MICDPPPWTRDRESHGLMPVFTPEATETVCQYDHRTTEERRPEMRGPFVREEVEVVEGDWEDAGEVELLGDQGEGLDC